MPPLSSASLLLAAIARSLGNLPYMIIGGQAVLLYGDPRLTQDVDVTLGVPPDQADAILAVAPAAGLHVLVDAPAEFARDTLVLPFAHDATGLRVDFIFSLSDYEREAIARARVVRLHDTDVRFAAPEDVVIGKVFAGRPRDLEDVRGMLDRLHEVDLVYIRRWLGLLEQGLDRPLSSVFEDILATTGHSR